MPAAEKKLKANHRTIADAEEFGLFFNCLTRRYLWNFDPEYADLMMRIMDRYLYSFSKRTLICAIRDLAEDKESVWRDHNRDASEYEDGRYWPILMRLVQRYLDIELADKTDEYWKRRVIHELATDGYFSEYYRQERNWRFPSVEAFEKWVLDNHLDEGGRMPVYEGDTLPFRAEFREDFLLLCLATVQYSYGRYSYMPGACRDFIKDHFVLITDEGLLKIDAEIEEDLREHPMSPEFGGDDETRAWSGFRNTIRLELIRRAWCTDAWNIYLKNHGFTKVIGDLANTGKYSSEDDYAVAVAKLDGLDRFLTSSRCHLSDRKKIRGLVAEAREHIYQVAEDQWFKENRSKYINTGLHQYRRRKDGG